MAQFGRKLLALRLDHIANNNTRAFGDEQASLGRALTACSSTDEYDFPFEAIHFVLHLLLETGADRGGTFQVGKDATRSDDDGRATGPIARRRLILIRSRWSNQTFESRLRSGQFACWLQKGGIEHLGCHDLATPDKPDLVRPVIGDGAVYRA